MKKCFCIFWLLPLFFARAGLAGDGAAPLPDSQFFSATSLGADIADWILAMSPPPKSLAVFDARAKAPLGDLFPAALEAEISGRLLRNGKNLVEVRPCLPCRALRASIVDDQVVIVRGAPSMEAFKEISQQVGVEAFLVIDVRRATTSAVAVVEMYSGSGQLLGSRNFSEYILDLDGSSAMLGFTATLGLGIGGKDSDDPSGAGDVFLLQELGGGRKGGLLIGGFAGNGGGGGYAMPTLAWTGRQALFNLRSMFMLGAGPGGSNKGYGLGVRASYQLFVGFCLFGLEGAGIIPITSKSNKESADAVVGVNIGIVFGR